MNDEETKIFYKLGKVILNLVKTKSNAEFVEKREFESDFFDDRQGVTYYVNNVGWGSLPMITEYNDGCFAIANYSNVLYWECVSHLIFNLNHEDEINMTMNNDLGELETIARHYNMYDLVDKGICGVPTVQFLKKV